jgi:type II secretory pathway component GspD/PulD (secretin)
MSGLKLSWCTILCLLGASLPSQAAEKVRLLPGEMKLTDFLAMVSERLDLSIDASGLDDVGTLISVPDIGPIEPERAKSLVLTALYLQSYSWIYNPTTDLYRVLQTRDARDQELPMLTDTDPLPDSDLLITYALPVHHTPSEYIARAMRSFMPANSRIIPDEATGDVLITDSAHNIAKLRKLVRRLDTPEMTKQTFAWQAERAKKNGAPCASSDSFGPPRPPLILIALFSLIALVIGFLARGYVIRRIEGGL